jgi:hypothetical protein
MTDIADDDDADEQEFLSGKLREAQRSLDEAVRDEDATFERWQRTRLRRALAASAVLALQEQIIDALRTV